MSVSPEQAQQTSRRVTILGASFLFFAYGSNMLTERLRERCPDARPLGTAIARGYLLSFSKRSKDGSAKATLVAVRAECGRHALDDEMYSEVYSKDDLRAFQRVGELLVLNAGDQH
jgi:hypothetical protein